MAKPKAKIHKWIDGILHYIEHEFESLTEAFEFGVKHHAKVIDEVGQVVHHPGHISKDDTYA